MGQDRSVTAALAVGKPGVKNCMTCHEAAGGGVLIKRGFAFTKENDVHAAKGMVCVDCHAAKDHRIPTGFDPNNWANDGLRLSCAGCHKERPHKDEDSNRHTARIACQTCHIPRTGGAFAKDFTRWTQGSDKFYEPSTLKREANETVPVYAWYNLTVANTPEFIGPKGSRNDKEAKITPFKIFQGKAYFDRKTGRLLSMDFAPPMANGDTLAGVASAAKTLGIKTYDPVPGWQTIYFSSSHLVSKSKALRCENCHSRNGVLNFQALGYSDEEIRKLTGAELYFDKIFRSRKRRSGRGRTRRLPGRDGRMKRFTAAMILLWGIFFLPGKTVLAREETAGGNGCLLCHGDAAAMKQLGFPQFTITREEAKAQTGMPATCPDCHLGNPSAVEKAEAHKGLLRLLSVKSERLETAARDRLDPYRPLSLDPKEGNLLKVLPSNLLFHDKDPGTLSFNYPVLEKTCGKCHPDHVAEFRKTPMGRNARQGRYSTWTDTRHGPHNCGAWFIDGYQEIAANTTLPYDRETALVNQKACNVCHVGCLDCHYPPAEGTGRPPSVRTR
jgi:hypothetical protein